MSSDRPTLFQSPRGQTTGVARFRRLAADVGGAAREAGGLREVRRAMARAGYGLGVALAAVAALSVHEALHAGLH